MKHDDETRNFLGDPLNQLHDDLPDDLGFEPYNDSEGEPDFTLEDDEEFEQSLQKALRWPEP